ncbi:MAG: hypothetical protein RIF46_07340 [Cyclobacteriaceae bacterium]
MKKSGILTTGFLTAVMLLAANDDAQAQTKTVAFNSSANESSKTVGAKALISPVVQPGSFSDAIDASSNGRLSIIVYGGTQDERSAMENAKILANAFADRRFTDKPMYITAVHKETGDDVFTTVAIYMNGVRYSKNNMSTFTPHQVGGAIDIIAEDFVDEHGNHLVIPEGVQPVVVASLN